MGPWPEVGVPGKGAWPWKEKQKVPSMPRSTQTEDGGLGQTEGDRPRPRSGTLQPGRDVHSWFGGLTSELLGGVVQVPSCRLHHTAVIHQPREQSNWVRRRIRELWEPPGTTGISSISGTHHGSLSFLAQPLKGEVSETAATLWLASGLSYSAKETPETLLPGQDGQGEEGGQKAVEAGTKEGQLEHRGES